MIILDLATLPNLPASTSNDPSSLWETLIPYIIVGAIIIICIIIAGVIVSTIQKSHKEKLLKFKNTCYFCGKHMSSTHEKGCPNSSDGNLEDWCHQHGKDPEQVREELHQITKERLLQFYRKDKKVCKQLEELEITDNNFLDKVKKIIPED